MAFNEFFKHYRLDDQNMACYQNLKQFQNWDNEIKTREFEYDEEWGKYLRRRIS